LPIGLGRACGYDGDMSESEHNKQGSGLRIQQIEAELTELEKGLKRIKEGTDEASARGRAELTERMQQLKAEQNRLIKQQGSQD